MKLKKIFMFSLIFLSFFAIAFISTSVYAHDDEKEAIKTVEVAEVTEDISYPCYIKEDITSGGDVLFDITEGNIGDTVTAYVKPNLLFIVSSIKINGNDVEINPEGKYQFNLIEGENIFSVEFVVNNNQLAEIADLVTGVKEEGFSSLFTVSNLLNLISWLVSILLSSGFFVTLIKNKKLKSKTVDDVVNLVKETLENENAKILKDFIEKLIGPTLDNITLKIDNIDECIKVFCRCFVLLQDDTPENKLAIIEELTKLNSSNEELTNKIREIIKQEQKAQEEKILARDKAIEELKENNDKLLEKNSESDSYGQV